MGALFKRKKYVVNKEQYKVTAVIVLYNVLAIFLAGVLVFLPSFIGLSSSMHSSQQVAAAQEIIVLHKRFWPAIIIVAAILGTHSIFFFHRFFGPLYRFKVTLKEVAKGDLSFNFGLRNKDFLTEEKEIINDMISNLRGNLVDLKQDNEALVSSIQQLESSLEDQETSLDTVRGKVKEIQENADKVSQGFEYFKLS